MASVASAAAASAAAVAVVPAHSFASAAVVSWNQPAGGNWSGLNWTGGAGANAPAANDTAAFNLAGSYSVNLNVSPSVAGLQVGGSNVTFTNSTAGRTFTNSGALTVSSGGFTLNAANPVNWTNGGAITFNANATVSNGNDLSAPSVAVGSGGNGNPIVTFTGAGTSLTLAGGIGVGNGGNGTLNFSTFATATAAGAIDIAAGGTTGSGVLIVQNGATLASQGIHLGTDADTTLGRTAGINVGGIGSALTNTGAGSPSAAARSAPGRSSSPTAASSRPAAAPSPSVRPA